MYLVWTTFFGILVNNNTQYCSAGNNCSTVHSFLFVVLGLITSHFLKHLQSFISFLCMTTKINLQPIVYVTWNVYIIYVIKHFSTHKFDFGSETVQHYCYFFLITETAIKAHSHIVFIFTRYANANIYANIKRPYQGCLDKTHCHTFNDKVLPLLVHAIR